MSGGSGTDAALAAAQAKFKKMKENVDAVCADESVSDECTAAQGALASANSELDTLNAIGSGDDGNNTGVIVGIVVALLIIVLAVVGFILYKKQNEKVTNMRSRMTTYEENSAVVANRAFVQDPSLQVFTPGQKNPLYDWYHPNMTRGDCDVHFGALGNGTFVVRDSQATPGWHMLCVKTPGSVLHDKIRMTDDGKYELLPTTPDGHDGARQPIFDNLPELVDFYTSARSGVGYTLVLANDVRGDLDTLYGGDYGDVAPPLPGKGPAPLDNPMYSAMANAQQGETYN